ncbi:MAG: hypothetical protein ACXVCY_07625 [Pseudobdellovibrionaceae bacterium]
MNIKQFLNRIPDFKEIQESPLVLDGEEVAFQSSVILNDGYCLGTGFSQDAKQAKQIALSEALERKIVFDLSQAPQAKYYLLDEFPSTCGFAVGNDTESTKDRAVAEAVERWLRSKWIDEHYTLLEFPLRVSQISTLEQWFASHFTEVRCFVHSTNMVVDDKKRTANSLITVGLTESGAFVGSKTVLDGKVPLLSALVETYRHLRLSKEKSQNYKELAVIKYYAENKSSALEQIAKAKRGSMPEPKLKMLKEVPTGVDGIYCFRAICENFRGWHGNEVTRFVY